MTSISENRKHRKRHAYTIALRALFEGRDKNPAHEELVGWGIIRGSWLIACMCDEHCFYIN